MLREPYPTPAHPLSPRIDPPTQRVQKVIILHPGYLDNRCLFSFDACNGEQFDGISYDFVITACTIVANMVQHGWLSLTRTGTDRTQPDANGLIPATTYYFHLPGGGPMIPTTTTTTTIAPDPSTVSSPPTTSPLPYPIVPNFRSWRFPHSALPQQWHDVISRLPEQRPATSSCRITNTTHRAATQDAHVIPVAEKSWFVDNNMDCYAAATPISGRDVADSPSNIFRLRSDVHYLWDTSHFAIVPQTPAPSPSSSDDRAVDPPLWTVKLLQYDPELFELYHDVPLLAVDIPAAFFFARFAYQLFPKIAGFLQTKYPRHLVVVGEESGVETTRMFSSQECLAFTLDQGRGRSTSPLKRVRTGQGGGDDGDSAIAGLESDETDKEDGDETDKEDGDGKFPGQWREDVMYSGRWEEEEMSRGRKRRRS